MTEIFEFVFRSFWTWLGTFLLLGVVAEGLGNAITNLRGK